jgi:hypothetical protein
MKRFVEGLNEPDPVLDEYASQVIHEHRVDLLIGKRLVVELKAVESCSRSI